MGESEAFSSNLEPSQRLLEDSKANETCVKMAGRSTSGSLLASSEQCGY
jgi:hypothetical protein